MGRAAAVPDAPHTTRARHRVAGALAVSVLAVLASPGTVHADAPGPTDFRSTVVAVTPPTETIAVTFIGGGSFVQLTADAGTEVAVPGYQGEPFLRVLADGTVEANDRSPSLYISRVDADGSGDVPEFADATLPPDWSVVGSQGRYAWHDHRAHWMSPDPPPGAQPGSRVMDGVVPLLVDGVPVEVAVAVDWLAPPSVLPLHAGAGIAGLVLLSGLLSRRRLAWPLLAAAVAAGALGWWQYRSLPAETGPLVVWWLLPLIAGASAVVALGLGRRLTSIALSLLAALQLAIWVYLRRDGARRPVLPTEAPFWLDRAVLAAVAVIAIAGTVGGLLRLARGPTPAG